MGLLVRTDNWDEELPSFRSLNERIGGDLRRKSGGKPTFLTWRLLSSSTNLTSEGFQRGRNGATLSTSRSGRWACPRSWLSSLPFRRWIFPNPFCSRCSLFLSPRIESPDNSRIAGV